MQVPFQLVRRTDSEPATALLLTSFDLAQLLRLCSQLDADPLPQIYPTADGFLLLLDQPTDRAWPECLRLRRLADHLLLPLDADLWPQLHAEEAAALTRKRGLVFLPGERVLEFSPEFAVETPALLTAGPVRRDGWQALPQRRFIAEQLRSVLLELPPQPPEAIVDEGGEGIGTEDPRPEDSSLGDKIAGRAQFGLGQALRRLGQALNWQGLKNMGERWMESAMEMVPRLSESVLGSQEAALRELLRRFREGDIEGALKRALPLGEPGGRGSAADNAILPTHNLNYSLGNILGGGGSGGASYWYGGVDIQRELFREYRKAAEEAAACGDWKRAAFIYGKLLADWREAAAVLARGGLHHDAAILYRDKLNDPLRAAVCFESAGEFDEALKIYERLREHEKAGDLLRRLGDEEAAIERYLKAADALVDRGKGPLAAGEFILHKTSRVDLAETYFASGWSLRFRALELGHAVPCAIKLAGIYSDREDRESFFTLLEEGEGFFAPAGNASAAGEFFNTIGRLADRQVWQQDRDELRDRCLLALAGKIRHQAQSDRNTTTLVSNLLGATGVWEPAVVRDAAFAVKQPLPQPKPMAVERSIAVVKLGHATIVAACQAPGSGEVFVGFYNGDLASFRPSDSRVTRICSFENTVSGLAVDESGDFLVVAVESAEGHSLHALRRLGDGIYQRTARQLQNHVEEVRFAPLIVQHHNDYLTAVRGLADDQPLILLRGADLLPFTVQSRVFPDPECQDLFLPDPTGREPTLFWLVFESHLLHRMHGTLKDDKYETLPINWRPQANPAGSITAPLLSWLRVEQDLWEIAGLGEAGGIYHLRLRLNETVFENERLLATNCANGYRCVTLIRPGVLAGITAENRLIWLRAESDRLKEFAPSQRLPSTSSAAACFANRATDELLVLLQDGSLLRIPAAK
ncbi:MAG TPA: hypothetical protein VGZ47_20930 [Gemmataceae bacterium]|jgi:tetratricopeptide (TPR) repeat protein|nr:hypothetical protein [Gemmataceae bacterium]